MSSQPISYRPLNLRTSYDKNGAEKERNTTDRGANEY
jgi:hypothetical protein